MRRLVDYNPDGMIVVDSDGLIRFANAAARVLFGKADEELIGKPFELPDESSEVELHGPDQEPCTVEIRSDEIEWEGETAILVTMRDITERKKMRQALKRSSQSLKNVLDSSLTGIAIVQDEAIVFRNSAFEDLFGPVTDLVHLTDSTHLDPEDPNSFESFFKSLRDPDFEKGEQDLKLMSKENSQRIQKSLWIHCRARQYEHEGKPAILLNTLDMTRSKETELLLSVHEKMTSLGRMTSGLTHDIRNALSSVNVYLSTLKRLLKQHNVDEDSFKIVDQIQTSSNRIEAIVNRVRDFAKPSEHVVEEVDINRILEDAIDICDTNLRRSDVKIVRNLDTSIPLCKLDPHLISRVLVNLIINASDALKSGDQKKVELATTSTDDKVAIHIADSGPGVPEHLRESIFDPFVTSKKDGTGIGLSICQRIITDHGGLLSFAESEMGGAEFVIELPIEGGGVSR